MGVAALLLVPAQTKPGLPWPRKHQQQQLQHNSVVYENRGKKQPRSMVPVARLFGPAIFEASKLKVLFLGVDEKKHPGNLPRTYTLTHSDITSKLTLAISHTINRAQLQGWYNRLQRDEVVAEWKKVQEKMSLHVHCHISGGHFLLDFIAKLRHYIFCKELPVVLKAFVHGDGNLFSRYPELEEAQVWVYFHSNLVEFNRVECWGPIREAAERGGSLVNPPEEDNKPPLPCKDDCTCCFPPQSLISWPPHFEGEEEKNNTHLSSLPTTD
ncbi:hypothetical protein H6P81_005012 [Aristolochia fimbriata]|uniref:Staygreen protein domain-containing protein n=1 Tax=Aristolochia fimbriata TaxID=158543 RepID=A0AAV7ETE1_ARIFI|nr:hypothetical protein H6P81_005012 [Aristolochia fimbriata]